MHTLIDIFRQLMFPVPPAWRVSLLIVLTAVLIFQVGPLLIAAVTSAFVFGAEPVVALLALPEYAVSSWLRDRSMQPLPGSYGYGRALEVTANATIVVAKAIGQRFGRRRPMHWLPTMLLASIPLIAFYGVGLLQNTK